MSNDMWPDTSPHAKGRSGGSADLYQQFEKTYREIAGGSGVDDDALEAARRVFPNHVHQYVIPVEWVYIYTMTRDGHKLYDDEPIRGKRVTKLRCECGAETER